MAKKVTNETTTNETPEAGTYQMVVSKVRFAVVADEKAVGAWKTAGFHVARFYGSAEAFEAVKVQFMADCIIPAIPEAQRAALTKDLPRKGSDEFKTYEGGETAWNVAQAAKIRARAYVSTQYGRIRKYAFPPEAQESDGAQAKRTLATKIAEGLAAFIKACEKTESAPFDLPREIAALRAALAIVTATK